MALALSLSNSSQGSIPAVMASRPLSSFRGLGRRLFNSRNSLAVRSQAMGTNAGTVFPNSGNEIPGPGTGIPESVMNLPFTVDLTTDQGCYDAARHIARKLVMATQQDAKTIDASILSVSRRYRLGTFLESLWKGKKATITLSKFVRLNRAWNEVRRARDQQAEQDRALAEYLERSSL